MNFVKNEGEFCTFFLLCHPDDIFNISKTSVVEGKPGTTIHIKYQI